MYCIVNVIRKECKHVEMNLIPKPVVELFQRLRAKPRSAHDQQSAQHSAGVVDWSKISRKLVSTLMQFQKEGIE